MIRVLNVLLPTIAVGMALAAEEPTPLRLGEDAQGPLWMQDEIDSPRRSFKMG